MNTAAAALPTSFRQQTKNLVSKWLFLKKKQGKLRFFRMNVTAAALRGVAIQRGRVGATTRATFPTGAAALALVRNPGPLAAAATALHPFAPA